MLTSESPGIEFHRFFRRYNNELAQRVFGLLNNKYRRTLIPILKNGGKIPNIFGTLKVGDIIMYGFVKKVEFKKLTIDYSLGLFLIMKDLRKQTRIMVVEGESDQD